MENGKWKFQLVAEKCKFTLCNQLSESADLFEIRQFANSQPTNRKEWKMENGKWKFQLLVGRCKFTFHNQLGESADLLEIRQCANSQSTNRKEWREILQFVHYSILPLTILKFAGPKNGFIQ